MDFSLKYPATLLYTFQRKITAHITTTSFPTVTFPNNSKNSSKSSPHLHLKSTFSRCVSKLRKIKRPSRSCSDFHISSSFYSAITSRQISSPTPNAPGSQTLLSTIDSHFLPLWVHLEFFCHFTGGMPL